MQNKNEDPTDVRDELIRGLQRENAAQAKIIKIQEKLIKTTQEGYEELQEILKELTEI